MPTYFECQRCTACCRWPGQVRVSSAEIALMAVHLGLSENEFIDRFARLRADRLGLSLTEQPDGACVFLDGRDCRVQPVKPSQCRGFPNQWNFPGFREWCRALPRELSEEEFRSRVESGTGDGAPRA